MSSTASTFESSTAPRSAARRAGIVRPLALCAGDLVRIVDAQGTLVHARTGLLWITDERSAGDIVLEAGQTHRIATRGTTIVEAQRRSRVVIDVPDGVRAPECVELAFPGRAARRVAFTRSAARSALARLQLALARTFTRIDWPAPDFPYVSTGRHPARAAHRHEPEDFTPEAVRDRLLRAHPYPFY